MAERWYLQVDGIEGDSEAEQFERWIEVDSYLWAVTASSRTTGSGRARGRPELANLVVTAPISVASPRLVDACATQRRAATAVLSGVREGGDERARPFLTYEMEDVTVVSVQHSDGPGASPSERVELSYEEIRVTYTPHDPRGGHGAPVVAVITR